MQTTWMRRGTVSGRVALLLRSAEIQPPSHDLFDWFLHQGIQSPLPFLLLADGYRVAALIAARSLTPLQEKGGNRLHMLPWRHHVLAHGRRAATGAPCKVRPGARLHCCAFRPFSLGTWRQHMFPWRLAAEIGMRMPIAHGCRAAACGLSYSPAPLCCSALSLGTGRQHMHFRQHMVCSGCQAATGGPR